MTQFQTVKFKGFEAQVTGHCKDGWEVGTVYLEMAGAEAQVKAIWAKLVSADMRKSGWSHDVEIGDGSVRMEKHTKYIALRCVLSNGQHVFGLLHPRAAVTEPGTIFYLVAEADHEGPPPTFFPRLAQALAVPVKEEWVPWLWARGLGYSNYDYQRLIRKLTSSGHVVGYVVNAHNADAWLKVIREELGFEEATC